MSPFGLPTAAWALLPLATASGLDLYLTLLFLGAAPRLGWEVSPPGGLEGLATPTTLAVAAVFYALEIVAERSAPAAVFWNAAHVVVRPVAAGLLVLLLLEGEPAVVRTGGVALAAALALGVHAVRVGGSLILWLSRARARTRVLAAAIEDVMVLGLCVLLLDRPVAGTGLALVLLLGASPQARSYVDAFRFGLRAAWGRTWGTLRFGRWSDPAAFPGWVRSTLREDPRVPGGPLRGSPAGAFRLPGGPIFIHGWFVVTAGAPLFLHRRWRRPRVLSLDPVRATGVSEDFLDRTVVLLRPDGGAGQLHFPPDGPTTEGLRAEFRIVS